MTITEHPTVSWDAPDGGEWALEDAHGAEVVPVAMRTEMEQAFADGFRTSLAELGMPLSHLEIRHVNDWPYVSVFVHEAPRKAGNPPPAFVLKLLTRLHPKSRARTKVAAEAVAERRPQSFATTWAAERAGWVDRLLSHQRVDPTSLDDAALADHVERGVAMGLESMRRHFELVTGSIPLGDYLLRAADWGLDVEQARRAIMYGTPIHLEATKRLRRIRVAVGDTTPGSLDEIRSMSDEAAAAVEDYLEHHGRWITEDHVAGPLLEDFPDMVLRSVMATAPETAAPPELRESVATLRTQVPAADRAEFDQLAADAQAAYRMLDDNSAILGAWGWGVVAGDLRAAAARLVAQGRLTDAAHLWALSTDDVLAMLRGGGPSADQAAARHATWRRHNELDPPKHLNGEGSPPPDPSVFPAPVDRLVAAMSAFLLDKFNDPGTAQGIGDTPATGRAVVVESASDALDRIEPGDILVTTATNPAYNSVLGIVGGLVVSMGGPSCHAAVVARELAIPTIVGYADATKRIADGSTITVDPTEVRVTTG